MKAVVLKKTGGPNVLSITEIQKPVPGENEILVKIKYSGINYADLLTRQGLYSWAPKRPSIMGLEAVGEVVEKGINVKNHEIGDRVFVGVQQGGYAEYITVDAQFALPIPEFYSWEEAGAFGVQFFTAWIGLHEMARVREGEICLVHAAAGGVGTAAVKLALAHKMEVYGTASSFKKNNVESMGATYLSYDNFDTELRKLNKLPDCVIETIGGDVFKRSFDNLAPMGRVVIIGASGIQVNKFNPLSWYRAWKSFPKASMSQVLRSSRGFMGLHVGYLLNYPDSILPSWQRMIEVVETEKIRPVIRKDHIFPMSRAADAHQLMHDRKNIGKILLDPTR